jgi:hypothetical protein
MGGWRNRLLDTSFPSRESRFDVHHQKYFLFGPANAWDAVGAGVPHG